MDFDFSDEQKSLKDQGRRLLAEYGDTQSLRRVFEGEAPFNRTLWEKAIELGWTGAAIPEEHGGLGLGYVTLCAIAEELGRALAPIPFSSSIFLAAEALALAGDDGQKSRLLPALASGDQIGTVALAEAIGPLGAKAEGCVFAGGRLNGAKIAVVDAGVADFAVVSAQASGKSGLYLVRLGEGAVAIEPQQGIDPSRPLSRLVFTNAAAEPLDAWRGSGSVVDRLLARASVLTAFEQLGGAEAALDLAKSYALERHAFGRPIGSFQAIKHKLAEVYVSIELARSQAYYAAWALESDAEELPLAAASARLAATAAFEQAARDLIQVHGGIGMTWEHDCHLFYRRSRHLALALGDQRQWRDRLVQLLVETDRG